MKHLNSDHLRTFLAILEAGSVTGGAGLINRSQSATSLQIRQLEETVGKPLFRRHGRGVVLTPQGEHLRPIAKNVIRSLDRTLSELRGGELEGRLRIGMPDDHTRIALAEIISDFAARYPRVELEVHCALGTGFETALATGLLDLAVFEVPKPHKHQHVLREDSLVWVGKADRDFENEEILPVAIFDRSCWWRDVAIKSLEDLGKRFEVVFTSESTSGIHAAIRSGIAIGLLNKRHDFSGLKSIPGLASPSSSFLVLETSDYSHGDACAAICELILRSAALSAGSQEISK